MWTKSICAHSSTINDTGKKSYNREEIDKWLKIRLRNSTSKMRKYFEIDKYRKMKILCGSRTIPGFSCNQMFKRNYTCEAERFHIRQQHNSKDIRPK